MRGTGSTGYYWAQIGGWSLKFPDWYVLEVGPGKVRLHGPLPALRAVYWVVGLAETLGPLSGAILIVNLLGAAGRGAGPVALAVYLPQVLIVYWLVGRLFFRWFLRRSIRYAKSTTDLRPTNVRRYVVPGVQALSASTEGKDLQVMVKARPDKLASAFQTMGASAGANPPTPP